MRPVQCLHWLKILFSNNQETRFHLSFCSVIFHMQNSSSRSEDDCSNFRHHVYILGRKKDSNPSQRLSTSHYPLTILYIAARESGKVCILAFQSLQYRKAKRKEIYERLLVRPSIVSTTVCIFDYTTFIHFLLFIYLCSG